MPKINRYVDISTLDKEAKKDFIDRHSPFVHCATHAKKGEKLTVKVKVGDQYMHPDDFDHFIKYIQLWDGDLFLGEAHFVPGVLGNKPGNVEVDFHIVPMKKMNIHAMSSCTKHGLWESDVTVVDVEE